MSDLNNKLEDLGGKAKESFGEATGNEKIADEGRADQTKADIKDAVSNAGEKLEQAKDKVLGAFQKDEEK
ncbi:CsbD family protein [Corynebacterium kozikiae]|uniref:CsbD family protein n=1 Tax=Corynebacterium kozikiae TaxID=2968469 RepID=UPI00211C9742|nr:CsbD family protein [Corynebacterium sp. 76QC2CO]MCQ9342231.1 CsbD family protein [Corynebacterium sp. 76QC2CO]